MVKKSAVVLIAGFVITILALAVWSRPDGKVHVWVMGGSKYLSIMTRSGNGRVMIINPTSDPEFIEKVSGHLPFYEKDLDLVIVTSGNEKDLDGLRKHFRVGEVWLSKDQANDWQRGLLGFESSSWQGVSLETFDIPSHAPLVKITYGDKNLLFAQKGDVGMWEGFPDKNGVDMQVGPEYSRGTWRGGDLARVVVPSVIYTNKLPQNASDNVHLALNEEVVW